MPALSKFLVGAVVPAAMVPVVATYPPDISRKDSAVLSPDEDNIRGVDEVSKGSFIQDGEEAASQTNVVKTTIQKIKDLVKQLDPTSAAEVFKSFETEAAGAGSRKKRNRGGGSKKKKKASGSGSSQVMAVDANGEVEAINKNMAEAEDLKNLEEDLEKQMELSAAAQHKEDFMSIDQNGDGLVSMDEYQSYKHKKELFTKDPTSVAKNQELDTDTVEPKCDRHCKVNKQNTKCVPKAWEDVSEGGYLTDRKLDNELEKLKEFGSRSGSDLENYCESVCLRGEDGQVADAGGPCKKKLSTGTQEKLTEPCEMCQKDGNQCVSNPFKVVGCPTYCEVNYGSYDQRCEDPQMFWYPTDEMCATECKAEPGACWDERMSPVSGTSWVKGLSDMACATQDSIRDCLHHQSTVCKWKSEACNHKEFVDQRERGGHQIEIDSTARFLCLKHCVHDEERVEGQQTMVTVIQEA